MNYEEARKILRSPDNSSDEELQEAIVASINPLGARGRSASDSGNEQRRTKIAEVKSARKTRGHRWLPPLSSGGVAIGMSFLSGLLSRAVSETKAVSRIDQLIASRTLFVEYLVLCLAVVAAGLILTRLLWPKLRLVSAEALLAVLLSVAVAYFYFDRSVRATMLQRQERVHELVRGVHWIAYDPGDFDPHLGIYPTEESIRTDMKVLKDQGGFSGIITFSNYRTLARIPYIAKEAGLKVILGVWITEDGEQRPDEEIKAAIAAAEAGVIDASCVGHVRGEATNLESVAQWMAELRSKTDLPVSHSAPIVSYIGERGLALRSMGDWYFPDVGGAWRVHSKPADALERTRADCQLAAELPRDKPVLLKMIGFPGRDVDDVSAPDPQLQFYQDFLQDMHFPQDVFPSFAFAFDKKFAGRRANSRPDQRDVAESRLGLFTLDLVPRAKPALAELRRNWGLLSPEPDIPKADYQIELIPYDGDDGKEWRLLDRTLERSFHFASVIQTREGALVFRPRPDLADDGAWGVSMYLAPFLTGEDSVGVTMVSAETQQSVVVITASSELLKEGRNAGQWTSLIHVGYDYGLQRVVGSSVLEVRLTQSLNELDRDLTLLRMSTNLMRSVVQANGTLRQSGDCSGVDWTYPDHTGHLVERGFFPVDSGQGNSTYPTDEAKVIEIFLHGNLNQTPVHDGPRKRSPDLRLQVMSLTESRLMFGTQWDDTKNDAQQNNFAVTPLIGKRSAEELTMKFACFFEASPPSLP